MIVYRVEHRKSNRGPYLTSDGRIAEALIEEHDETRPFYMPPPGYRCGFSSLPELYAWFVGWEARLKVEDFVICVYKASQVDHDDQQLGFCLKSAELTKVLDL